MRLKSGSDIRGIAVQTENSNVTLTMEAICDITKAFLKWLSEKVGKDKLTIAVGNDVRISCAGIYQAVKDSVLSCGCDVIYCGMATTPSMYLLLKESGWDCDASIMITASHLPYDRNGLKFFTPEGGLSSEDITDVLSLAQKGASLKSVGVGTERKDSFMGKYCEKLINVVRDGTGTLAPLFGKRIIVDASNGVGGYFANDVLSQLGAITDGSINLTPDGDFPGHVPNPEAPEAIQALSDAVIKSHAELGVIFDTDGDRAAVVDGNGKLINRDNLIALTAAVLLNNRPATIVTDSVTTDGLTEFIGGLGGKHVRFKRGYKNVIDEAKRRNAAGEYCPLAIETSGHAAFMENYFLDDGAYLVCKLLIAYHIQSAKRQKLSDLIAKLPTPAEENEVRLRFNKQSQNYILEGDRVIAELKFYAQHDKNWSLAPDNYEGVRINFLNSDCDGWALVRQSVHDPVLPINFASRKVGGNRQMAKAVYYVVAKYPFLDVSALEQFIKSL